jgi:hypothetical protein
MGEKASSRELTTALLGRSFVHPLFDYALIGGGLSLILTAFVLAKPERGAIVDEAMLPWFMLVSNSAHFASSTVRLYTKPGTQQALPFLTFAFPLVVMVLLTGCLLFAGSVGPHLNALYFTWSPYHYAAQAYGLAVMYAYRSGCSLAAGDKQLLWWTSMLPFFYAFVSDQGSGLHWLLPKSVFANASVDAVHLIFVNVVPILSIAAAGLLFVKVAIGRSGPLPLISIMMLVANTAWWCFLPQDAFVWATIFHGIQYLAIVTIFHVKDQMSQPENRRSELFHMASFYGLSLLLGYGLFSCLPWGFVMAGFGMVESIALSVATINIHHFIVDAYIWRLKPGDRNRAIVESEPATGPAEEAVAA